MRMQSPSWWEPKISGGNVLTVLVLIVSIVLAWGQVRANTEKIPEMLSIIATNTGKIAVHDQRIVYVERTINREVMLQGEQRREILERLDRIEDKLDKR